MKKYAVPLFALALAVGSMSFVGCSGKSSKDPKHDDEGESVPADPKGSGESKKTGGSN